MNAAGPGRWLPIAVCALVCGTIATVVTMSQALEDAPRPALEIDMAATAGGVLQVFYDRGDGMREADSVTTAFGPSDRPQRIRLPLPFGSYGRFRIDPNTIAGRYSFHRIAIVDGADRLVTDIPPGALRAGPQTTVEVGTKGEAVVIAAAGAHDPQVTYDPERPLLVLPQQVDQAKGLAAFVAAACGAIVLLWLASRLPRARPALGAMLAAADRHPFAAAACAGALGALAATYPLLFGRSLVSPANGPAYMLYDQAPYTYAFTAGELEDARGADVGAMMWQNLPYTIVQRQALAQGEWPLWNRYNLGGVPLWGQGQTFILDPFHLLSLAIPDPSLALDIRFVVARVVCAVGVAGSIVATTGTWPGAALMAATAPFLGHFTMRFNHPAYFAIVYVPWILWAYVNLARDAPARRWRHAAWIAVATSLQMVGSTPKEGMMALVAAHVAGLSGLLLGTESLRQKFGRVDAALLGGITAILLTTPHWLIFLDTLSRARTAYDQPAVQLAGWPDAIAYALGAAAPGPPLTGAHPVAVLSALTILAFPRQLVRCGPALGALAAVVVIGALSFGAVPVDWLLRLPLVGNIHSMANAGLGATLVPLVQLGGIGTTWLIAHARREPSLAAVLVVAGSTVIVIALLPNVSAQVGSLIAVLSVVTAGGVLLSLAAGPAQTPASAVALLMCTYLAVSPGGLQFRTGVKGADDLLIQPAARAHVDAVPPALQAIHERGRTEPYRVAPIGGVLFPGTQALWGVESVGGPDALRLPSVEDLSDAALVERTDWKWRTVLSPSQPVSVQRFLDMMNVRFLVARRDQLPTGLPLLQQGDGDLIRAAERETWWPRAFFAGGVERHTGALGVAARLVREPGPFASVDEHDPTALDQVQGLPASGPTVPGIAYRLTTNSTSFRVETTQPGVAVLTETFVDRDFVATVNGTRVPYFRVNHAFKGVRIPGAGTWTVRFEYRPDRWRIAWGATAVGVVAWAALLVANPLLWIPPE